MKKRGFTLIELLVTLSLVTFLIAGTGELISLSLLAKRKAEAHAGVIHLLTDKLEGLRSLPFDASELRAGQYEEGIAARGADPAFLVEWNIEDLSGGTKRIGIRVSSRGRTRATAKAVLLVSKKLGFRP
jgi:prepilin-type N-terminal cleavage/methylation domain-containing protein